MRGLLLLLAPLLPGPLLKATPVPAAPLPQDRPLPQEDPRVLVRVDVQPAQPVLVGQKVEILVEVLCDTWFSRAPVFDLPELEGWLLARSSGRALNATDRVEGSDFTGTRTRLFAFPLRPGEVEVPPIGVRVTVARPGGDPVDVERSTEPLPLAATMPAELPAGARGLTTLISTPRLEGTQRWLPVEQEGPLQVGDGVTRVLTFEADDVLGLAFPPLVAGEQEGVRTYLQQPVVEDSEERGRLLGRRTETLVALFEQPGTHSLPDVVLRWWNLDRSRLERLVLEGRTFEVLPGPAGAGTSDGAGGPERGSGWLPGGWLLGGLLGASLLAVGWVVRRRRARRTRSAFSELRAACRDGDAARALQLLYLWSSQGAEGYGTCEELAAGRPGLGRELIRLQEAALRADGSWKGRPLLELLLELQRRRGATEREGLPALNPDRAARPRRGESPRIRLRGN